MDRPFKDVNWVSHFLQRRSVIGLGASNTITGLTGGSSFFFASTFPVSMRQVVILFVGRITTFVTTITNNGSGHLPFLIIKDKIKAKFISLRFKVIKFSFICKILSSELKLGLFEQASFLLNLKILSEFIQ
jgi:hypothetical protein